MVIGEANSEDGWVVCRVFKKKNYHKAIMESSQNSLMDTGNHHHLLPSKDGILDRILVYMGRTTSSSCKQENGTNNSVLIDHQGEDDISSMHFLNNNNNPMMMHSAAAAVGSNADVNFMHLPRLESPSNIFNQDCTSFGASPDQPSSSGLSDWVALDRLVASQLNGHDHDHHHQEEEAFCFPGFDHNNNNQRSIIRSHHQAESEEAAAGQQVYGGGEVDFWSFARTPSTSSSSDPLCHLSV